MSLCQSIYDAAQMWESLQCHGLVLVKPIHTLLYIWSTSSSWKQPIQSEFRLESLPVAANCNQGSWGRNALIAWGVPCVQFLQIHNLYAAWKPNKLLRIPGIEVQIGNDSKLVFRLTPRRNNVNLETGYSGRSCRRGGMPSFCWCDFFSGPRCSQASHGESWFNCSGVFSEIWGWKQGATGKLELELE